MKTIEIKLKFKILEILITKTWKSELEITDRLFRGDGNMVHVIGSEVIPGGRRRGLR